MAEINILGDQLHHWYSRLDPQLYYRKDGLPSVAVMQYASPDVTKTGNNTMS